MEAASLGFRCEKCSERLGAMTFWGEELAWKALASHFPGNLLQCAVSLKDGPSSLLCLRCGCVSQFDVPHVFIGPKTEAVLYLPDDTSNPDSLRYAQVLATVTQLRGDADPSGLSITRDHRTFRREFITRFLLRSMHLGNSFAVASARGQAHGWIVENENALTASFFAAHWLAANGAIQIWENVGGTDTHAPQNLQRFEDAPEDVHHVVKTKRLREAAGARAGSILGSVLILWAQRAVRDHSFEKYRVALQGLISSDALSDDTMSAAGEVIGTAFIDPDQSGAIMLRYICEAVMAILCHENRRTNPRMEEWTRSLVAYEFGRRRVNDETLQLPPEFLRETMDEAAFWSSVGDIQQWIGSVTEGTAELLGLLDAMVEHVLPGFGTEVFKLQLAYDRATPDENVVTHLRRTIPAGVDRLPDTTLLRALFVGLSSSRRHLLHKAAEELKTALAAGQRSASDHLVCLRLLMETSNAAQRYDVARAAAAQAEYLISVSPEAVEGQHAHLLNEIGNCLRYDGDLIEALRHYDMALDLFGRDIANRNTRVILANRAIVLRDLHRYRTAYEAFSELRQFAHGVERVGLATSEAMCLNKMGESKQALALLDEHRKLAELLPADDRRKQDFLAYYAQRLIHHERHTDAKVVVQQLTDIADQEPNPDLELITAQLAWQIAREDASNEERVILRERVITLLLRASEHAKKLGRMTDAEVGGIYELNAILIDAERLDDAEVIVRDFLRLADPARNATAWLLALEAYYHSARRNNRKQAAKDLCTGVEMLRDTVTAIAAEDDAIAALGPNSHKIVELVNLVWHGFGASTKLSAAWLRVAGDLLAAPILTARLRNLSVLPTPHESTNTQAELFSALFTETPAAILQIMALYGDTGVLVTRPGDGGIPLSEARLLGLKANDVEQIGSRLSFALRRANPDQASLQVDSFVGWTELRERLRDAVATIPTDLPLCIIPGPLSSAAATLALSSDRGLCFCPSVGVLLALRERRRRLPGGLAWRPRSMFDFASWFESEQPKEATALAATAHAGAAAAAAHGLAYHSAVGEAATGHSLLNGLAQYDLARISCHGRILPGAESVDLIVADEGRLPPRDLTRILSHARARHVLGWRQLAAVPSAATIVISSACDSGLAIAHQGGERLGLERPLFQAGTVVFVAPQWPVPTVAMQSITARLLEDIVSSHNQSISASVARQRIASLDTGSPPLAAESFAVFGDGL